MYCYIDTVKLPGTATISDAQGIEEMLCSIGSVEAIASCPWGLRFRVEAEDLWDLRSFLVMIETDLASRGFEFTPDKERVQDLSTVEKVV